MQKKKYSPIIGLEIHVQLNTQSKMFCGCSTDIFGAKPNTHVCPVCLGLPGALPVPNRDAIEKTIQIALVLGCQINLESRFDRKNYFYPDLPKGYQITQYSKPLGVNGRVGDVHIRRVHLEEDTGTLKHEGDHSLVNFNRSGIPLVEIVTDPDLHSAADAKEFLKKLHQVVRWIGASDADMEKGSLRIEPSVSVLEIPSDGHIKPPRLNAPLQLPEWRVELKNINSFRFAERAIEYEVGRLSEMLKKGETPRQETRGFDENKGITFEQRVKEEEADYRYFPEPDVPPLRFSQEQVDQLRSELPELPKAIIQRTVDSAQFAIEKAKLLVRNRETWSYYSQLVELGMKAGEAANLVINQPKVLDLDPKGLVEARQREKEEAIGSGEELKPIIEKVIAENLNAVADYRSGDKNAINFLIGQVMKGTHGKAEAGVVRNLLLKTL